MSTEYFVASNLQHDGKDFVRGDKITLSEEQAKPLLAVKTIQTRPIRKEEPVDELPETPDVEVVARPRAGGRKTETGEPAVDGREETPEVAADNDTTPEVAQGRTVRSVAGDNDTTQTEKDPSAGL